MNGPDTGRTAEEMRALVDKARDRAKHEASYRIETPDGRVRYEGGEPGKTLYGQLANAIAHLRAENANLRDRVREAEGAGRDPDGSGSRPSDQAASHPAPAGFDPSRAPWPSGCIKPGSCSRHRQCMYAQSPKQCRHLGQDLTPDIEAAEARHAR